MSVLILSEEEVRECAALDKTSLSAIEEAFTWTASDPPRDNESRARVTRFPPFDMGSRARGKRRDPL